MRGRGNSTIVRRRISVEVKKHSPIDDSYQGVIAARFKNYVFVLRVVGWTARNLDRERVLLHVIQLR